MKYINITKHYRGLATSALFRGPVFKIHFLGLSKLVAVETPAPECGRYIVWQVSAQ